MRHKLTKEQEAKLYTAIRQGDETAVFKMFADKDFQAVMQDPYNVAQVLKEIQRVEKFAEDLEKRVAASKKTSTRVIQIDMTAEERKSRRNIKELFKALSDPQEVALLGETMLWNLKEGNVYAVANGLTDIEIIDTKVLKEIAEIAQADLNELEKSIRSKEGRNVIEQAEKLQRKLVAAEPGDAKRLKKAESFIQENEALIRKAEIAQNLRSIISVVEPELRAREKASQLEPKSFVSDVQDKKAVRPTKPLDLVAIKKQSQDKKENPEAQLKKLASAKDNATLEGQAKNSAAIMKLLSKSEISFDARRAAYKHAEKNGYQDIQAVLKQHDKDVVRSANKKDMLSTSKGNIGIGV